MRIASTIGLAAMLAALLPAAAPAASNAEYPTNAADAMVYYESDPDTWLDGPIDYIILDQERAVYKELQSRTEQTRFIRQFWERRDHDLRDRKNLFRDQFYERVAHANRRYKEHPKGWESDRGRMHVVLGRPDHVRVGAGNFGAVKTWTYYTVGKEGNERPFGGFFGEVVVRFVSTRGRNRYELFDNFGGPGHYPRYVRDLLLFANMAAVDPSLTRKIVD